MMMTDESNQHLGALNLCFRAQLLEKTVGSHQKSGDVGPDKSTFCRHCHTSFETHGQLRAHAIKALVFCEFCRTTHADTKEYQMHMLEEHPMDDTCQFCGAYIPDREGLVIHIRKHTSMGPIMYKCFGCHEMFSSVSKKNDHACSAYPCPQCSEPQNGPDGLEEHLKVAHYSPEPKAPAQSKAVKRSSRHQSHTTVRGKLSVASVEIDQPPQ
jgi:hypothetical protein